MPRFDADLLCRMSSGILQHAGVPKGHSALQTALLLEAELRGVPSHGLLRLLRIVERIGNGVIDPGTSGAHEWRREAFLSVDGLKGLGPVVADRALTLISERARQTGIALAAVRNSNHIGMLGFYAERLAKAGQTALVFSTSEALVHPWGGRQALLGTNPVAIGVPTEAEPFVMDTATSIVSMGEVHDHANRGAPLQPGWALDEKGDPTTDAQAAKSGALAPFGGAKGYALGLAFGLLTSSLTGAALGREVRGTLDSHALCNKGDLFIVIDGPNAMLAEYLAQLRDAEPADGFERVLIPGERGRACRMERLRNGIPLADRVWADLQRLAKQAGIKGD
ncbi:Ldh family oxidoreductase [Devosia sp. Naph2]|uniref:Ldh family oxidoreductase n=1 Tax=Devosia polycyclovorans TaxID=3345148 RepID=UPI0035CE97D6